jgi:hypothetical protein
MGIPTSGGSLHLIFQIDHWIGEAAGLNAFSEYGLYSVLSW